LSSKPEDRAQPAKKAGLRQVAATLFWGLLMIGKKDTWERDGVTVTLAQMVIGGLLMGALVIGVLLLLVKFATA